MMTAVDKLLIALLGLLIVQNGWVVEAVFTMNETCSYYPKGYIANPDDCQSWGYCKGGALLHHGKCEKGMLYDVYKGVCNWAKEVRCATSTGNICANLADPGHVAVPTNCKQYCYCANQKMLKCYECPNTQLYDPNSNACVYNYKCPIDSICRLVPNNAFVGSPTACGEFIRCLDGFGTSEKCTNSNYFNRLTGLCQANDPCTASTTPNDNSPLTSAPDPKICSAYDENLGTNNYIADSNTCYGYYSCSSKSGSGFWRSCPFGTQFDPANKKCVSPISVACTKNRCGNINLNFVTVPNSTCGKYYVCNNYQQVNTPYSCPSDYPFFDEIKQGCVKNKPAYPICT